MAPKTVIESYFLSWINQDRKLFDDIFSESIVYTECYGPEYHGLTQIKNWFDDWNKYGCVLIWDIKKIYHEENVYIVEWFFKCDYKDKIDGFNGVSIILFDSEGKITSIKEFQSKSEKVYPYGK